jgi:hypothetical protein
MAGMSPILLSVLAAALAASSAQAEVAISNGQTRHITCSTGGVCTPDGERATLNIGDLTSLLAAGDVKITTGGGAVSITVIDTFSWTSAAKLTLDAQQTVSFRAPMVVAGPGGVTIVAGGGAPVFFNGGSVDFWDDTSKLAVNGAKYKLVFDIHSFTAAVLDKPNGRYALAADYDAKPDGVYGDIPVDMFDGTLEGLGHTISHLTVRSRQGSAAFIDKIQAQGVVRDVAFTGAFMNGLHQPGALSAFAAILAIANAGAISHVRIDGTVATKGEHGNAAGLVLVNGGTIDRCTSSVSAKGPGSSSSAAGFVSTNDTGGIITNSHASGTVTGGLAGGFAMQNGGTISLSSASGAVIATGNSVASLISGGFVAVNYSTIDRSFATGSVHADAGHQTFNPSIAGGFVGDQRSGSGIVDSYATGAVSVGSAGSAAGFARTGGDAIATSWSSGTVGASDANAAQGFAFAPPGTAAHDYWDTDTSGLSTGCNGACPGVTGLSTAQFQSGLPAGFDPAVWAQSPGIGNGFPYLIDNPPQ